MKRIALAVAFVGLAGCGGGGGGTAKEDSAGGFYAGTWDIQGAKVSDDCRTGLPTVATNTVVVNQDGSRVVVDSGNLVLTGSTNSRDGFEASESAPGSPGCTTATSYSFDDASDGNAIVAFGIGAQCSGRTCLVLYSGSGTRRNARVASFAHAGSPDHEADAAYVAEVTRTGPAGAVQGAGDVVEMLEGAAASAK